MKKLMNILMLSCKRASGLIEKKANLSLNPLEKVQLFIHTGMCDACKSYEKQSKDLDSILDKHMHSTKPESSKDTLSTDIKNKIISDLENK